MIGHRNRWKAALGATPPPKPIVYVATLDV